MVTIDIKENIRFFKPNDPYYYEVDNLPLIDLLNNDKILRDEINFILAANSNYASEAYVQTNIQAAIGSAGEVDIDGDGITPAFTDLISWIIAQGYLTEVATNIGDLLDVDTTSNVPGAGDALIYDDTITKWVPGENYTDPTKHLGIYGGYNGTDSLHGGSHDHTVDPNHLATNWYEATNHADTKSVHNGVRLPKGHYRFEFTSSRGWTQHNVYHYAILKTKIDEGLAAMALGNNILKHYGGPNHIGYSTPNSTGPGNGMRISNMWLYDDRCGFRYNDFRDGQLASNPGLSIVKSINSGSSTHDAWAAGSSGGLVDRHLSVHHSYNQANQETMEGCYYFTITNDVEEVWFTTSHHTTNTDHGVDWTGFRGDLYYIAGYPAADHTKKFPSSY